MVETNLFECIRDIDHYIEDIVIDGSIKPGCIGRWNSSRKRVFVIGVYQSRSRFPGLMGTPIRWRTEGINTGILSSGLAYVMAHYTVNLPKSK